MQPSQSPLPPAHSAGREDADAEAEGRPAAADLSGIAIAGITRRRLAFLAGSLVTVWILVVFARQVGEASTANSRVVQTRDANAALAGRVAALEREYELIQRRKWIRQQAHAYGLGEPGEIPFALGDAGPLPPDAPGSAAVRLGAITDETTPLEAWLSLLFGPDR